MCRCVPLVELIVLMVKPRRIDRAVGPLHEENLFPEYSCRNDERAQLSASLVFLWTVTCDVLAVGMGANECHNL